MGLSAPTIRAGVYPGTRTFLLRHTVASLLVWRFVGMVASRTNQKEGLRAAAMSEPEGGQGNQRDSVRLRAPRCLIVPLSPEESASHSEADEETCHRWSR